MNKIVEVNTAERALSYLIDFVNEYPNATTGWSGNMVWIEWEDNGPCIVLPNGHIYARVYELYKDYADNVRIESNRYYYMYLRENHLY